jgi:hypothetical protein
VRRRQRLALGAGLSFGCLPPVLSIAQLTLRMGGVRHIGRNRPI